MMVKINRVVTMVHSITDPNTGKELDSSTAEYPLVFLYGRHNVDIAIERAIRNKTKGFSFETEITYSPPDPSADFEVDRSLFAATGTSDCPEVGEVVVFEDSDGPITARIKYIDEYQAVLTTNEPWAGKTVIFTGRIISVQSATYEEIRAGGLMFSLDGVI